MICGADTVMPIFVALLDGGAVSQYAYLVICELPSF